MFNKVENKVTIITRCIYFESHRSRYHTYLLLAFQGVVFPWQLRSQAEPSYVKFH